MGPPPVDDQHRSCIKSGHAVTAECMTKVMVDVMETLPRVAEITKIIQFPASMPHID